MGKTAFALGMASHAAIESRRPVLVFSLEMGQHEVSQRILCSEARVDSTRVRTGKLTDEDWGKISNAVGRIADAPVYIDDNANISVMDIRAKSRRLRSQLGDLGLVIIDYVQLMTGRSNAESRQVEVSEISRSLKILARELETPGGRPRPAQPRPRAARRQAPDALGPPRIGMPHRIHPAAARRHQRRGHPRRAALPPASRDVPVWSLDERWRLVAGHAHPRLPDRATSPCSA